MFSMKLRVLFSFYFLTVLNTMHIDCAETTVQTKLGIIVGETAEVGFDGQNRTIQRYLGIPYATAPIGKRRFARPEPYGQFSKPWNATFHRPHCLQTVPAYYKHLESFEKSEDCLFLNLYIPGVNISTKNSFPVMIYIHGGSFALGGSDIYSGDILSAFSGVITVTINYRLNVFGFLSDGSKSSGNFGLWDMRLAIQWVHENILFFGGDPTRVTLFGNSAGGAAVMFQAMFPENRGLFQRIIAQSGSSLAHWAFQRGTKWRFSDYVKKVGCKLFNYDAILECLRQKTARELQVEYFDFVPATDHEFLLGKPLELLKANDTDSRAVQEFFSEIEFMNGVTSQDGAVSVPIWVTMLQDRGLDVHKGVPRYYFEEYISERLRDVIYRKPSQTFIDAAIHQYTDWAKSENPKIIRDQMVDFESDIGFNVPAMKASRMHSGSTYFYVFDHKPSFVPDPKWITGAAHTMEIPYIFGLHDDLEGKLVLDYSAVDPFTFDREDIRLAKIMMTLWSNFAKSGNPNEPVQLTKYDVPRWPAFNHSSELYLNIESNMTSQSVRDHFAASRVAFWTNLVPSLRENCEDTDVKSQASFISCCYLIVLLYSLYSIIRYLLQRW